MHITLAHNVQYIIKTLEENDFEAYAVGGCIRDTLLGKTPQDWDICTQALPEQTAACFKGKRIFETGIKHGTISLLLGGKTYEITTFRTDGNYTDNRRPESVTFVSALSDDLARRDFTINAIAYHPDRGLIDPFGGAADIENKLIRCVGDAENRFDEDALRIMRALRFSSALGFTIEPRTADALLNKRRLLHNISAERIREELNRLVAGDNAAQVMLKYSSVITTIIPEISNLIGFEQNTPYHDLDIWNHTIKSMTHVPADKVLRLTMLLHDIGKPPCYTYKNGKSHFHGHQKIGAEMARHILRRLKYDNNTVHTVTLLITYHDADIPARAKAIRRWLNKIGEHRLRQLLAIKRADIFAQSSALLSPRLEALNAASKIIDEIIEQKQCYRLSDLAINGRDLIAIGITNGSEIGQTLNTLLHMVLDGEIENERLALLDKSQDLH
ncbi:MAG: HD domain-containing protein [Oscillospiraceae bacterium]|nr:HD domain-containing protein [Oscillospiraceae bacterium]